MVNGDLLLFPAFLFESNQGGFPVLEVVLGLKLCNGGKIGNCCSSSSALTLSSGTLKNFAKAERAEGESCLSMKAPRRETSGKRVSIPSIN